MENLKLIPVLLPTEDAIKENSLFMVDDKLSICTDVMSTLLKYEDKIKPQHLYLCSNLPIKQGDWYYFPKEKNIKRCDSKFEANGINAVRPEWIQKIEFTTDIKLHFEKSSGLKTFHTMVPAIDGNTKTIIPCIICKGRGCGNCDGLPYQVNFLSEFVKRWNEKDKRVEAWRIGEMVESKMSYHEPKDWKTMDENYNPFIGNKKENQKGVDIEKLADEQLGSGYDNYDLVRASWIAGFKYSQALQSNAAGFSEDDMKKLWNDCRNGVTIETEFEDYIKSFTKEQYKGDIAIECEMMVDVKSDLHYINDKPKLKDGQPILIFK